jgi:mono/diheme cytochrome c family protein
LKTRKLFGLVTGIITILILASCTPATTSPADLMEASLIYSNDCASCHGPNREGDNGPDITNSNLKDISETGLVEFIADHKTGQGLTSVQISTLANWLKNTP